MKEAITAIELHMVGLKDEFERIVLAARVSHPEQTLALDTIKSKMLDCEKAIELLRLIDNFEL
jgi:hypothetical protein